MLRGAPPAAGSTGTVGRARTTPELHGAVQRATVGRWLPVGRGRAAGATRRRMLILAPPAARPFLGSLAASGPEELLDSERDHAWSHAHLGTAGREPILGIVGCERAGGAARLRVDLHVYACPPWHSRPRDPQGVRELRAGRSSCVTRGGHTDVNVTQ